MKAEKYDIKWYVSKVNHNENKYNYYNNIDAKKFVITGEVINTNSGNTTIQVFVKVKNYSIENLHSIGEEVCLKYKNSENDKIKYSAIILNLYQEKAESNLNSKDIADLKGNYPKLVTQTNNLQIVKNGYIYRAFYLNSTSPTTSLVKSDFYIPKCWIRCNKNFWKLIVFNILSSFPSRQIFYMTRK